MATSGTLSLIVESDPEGSERMGTEVDRLLFLKFLSFFARVSGLSSVVANGGDRGWISGCAGSAASESTVTGTRISGTFNLVVPQGHMSIRARREVSLSYLGACSSSGEEEEIEDASSSFVTASVGIALLFPMSLKGWSASVDSGRSLAV